MNEQFEAYEIHDHKIGGHRVSFAVHDGTIRYVIIDDAHFTCDEFEELYDRYANFMPGD